MVNTKFSKHHKNGMNTLNVFCTKADRKATHKANVQKARSAKKGLPPGKNHGPLSELIKF